MLRRILQGGADLWAVARGRLDHRIDDPVERRRSELFAAWVDHGHLRRFWRNFDEIEPGLFRANHPDARQLAVYHAMGIRDVLSLRAAQNGPHLLEAEACAALGMRLRNVALSARQAPSRRALLDLLDKLESLQRPALIHCKSGADRTGLAEAFYRIHMRGEPVSSARRGLSARYLHFRWSRTGVLDRVLDTYEARLAAGPITLRDWVETEYRPEKT